MCYNVYYVKSVYMLKTKLATQPIVNLVHL